MWNKVKQSYLNCLLKLRKFRKSLINEIDKKRGRLYFSWLEIKTDKIQNEKDVNYIYNHIVKDSLPNYKIDEFSYNRADKTLKKIIDKNYVLKKNYRIFNNSEITYDEAIILSQKLLFRRGNVVWIHFGFNIGNEFGGMHPAIILKNLGNDLFVLPVSSKKPAEYLKIEKEFNDNNSSEEEMVKKKNQIVDIIQLDNIVGFRNMIRWANITRMKKVSILRLNFGGTIGRVDGKYLNIISEKISKEF